MLKPARTLLALTLPVLSLFALTGLLAVGGCTRAESSGTEANATPSATRPQVAEKTLVAGPGGVRLPQPRRSGFSVKRCMNMGNALEAPREGDWGYRIRARDFKAVRRAGFDSVRIPIRWDAHADHRPPYKIDPAFMARIFEVTKQAQDNGLGVILDMHHYEALIEHPARERARFLGLWAQIAHAFSDAPGSVYFEVLNEPTNALSNAELSRLYAQVLPVIRKENATRKVIVGGNSWNSIEALGEIRLPRDVNLVATFHDYSPHEFTHQGAEWSEPKLPLGRHYGTPDDLTDKRSIYAQARAFRVRTGLPVFVGEFGVINKVPLAERVAWTADRRRTIERNGLSWCAWDFAGAFNSYDTDANRWLPGMVDALTGR